MLTFPRCDPYTRHACVKASVAFPPAELDMVAGTPCSPFSPASIARPSFSSYPEMLVTESSEQFRFWSEQRMTLLSMPRPFLFKAPLLLGMPCIPPLAAFLMKVSMFYAPQKKTPHRLQRGRDAPGMTLLGFSLCFFDTPTKGLLTVRRPLLSTKAKGTSCSLGSAVAACSPLIVIAWNGKTGQRPQEKGPVPLGQLLPCPGLRASTEME